MAHALPLYEVTELHVEHIVVHAPASRSVKLADLQRRADACHAADMQRRLALINAASSRRVG